MTDTPTREVEKLAANLATGAYTEDQIGEAADTLRTLLRERDEAVDKLRAARSAADLSRVELENVIRQRDEAEAREAVLVDSLKAADEWLSCVEPHLRDGATFKRDVSTIRAVMADPSPRAAKLLDVVEKARQEAYWERQLEQELDSRSPEGCDHASEELQKARVARRDALTAYDGADNG